MGRPRKRDVYSGRPGVFLLIGFPFRSEGYSLITRKEGGQTIRKHEFRDSATLSTSRQQEAKKRTKNVTKKREAKVFFSFSCEVFNIGLSWNFQCNNHVMHFIRYRIYNVVVQNDTISCRILYLFLWKKRYMEIIIYMDISCNKIILIILIILSISIVILKWLNISILWFYDNSKILFV